jgi:hypothetical protein
VLDCGALSIACLLAYWLVADLRSQIYSLSTADNIVGGLWAVIATVFVFRDSYQHSVSAAVSRMEATLVSFAWCLIYLIFLPFHPWAMAVLIGASTLTVTLLGRPEEVVTAGVTTAVVMVSAALSPQNAWQLPFLRLADTIVGVAVGVAAAWAVLRVLHPRLQSPTGERSLLMAGARGRDVREPVQPRGLIHTDTWAGSRAWCTTPAKSFWTASSSRASCSRAANAATVLSAS